MERIEDPADAAPLLLACLRVISLSPPEQIALFAPHCVACAVHSAFGRWEEQFADAEFAAALAPPQRLVLQRIRAASEAVYRDPQFECNENRFVRESAAMAALREAGREGLAALGWSPGPPELKHVYGTSACGQRLQDLIEQRRSQQLAARQMKPTVPRFHAATFQMHGHSLLANQFRLSEMERWEERHGVQLPGAVREWYATEGPDLWERLRPRDRVPRLDALQPLRPALVRVRTPGDDDEPFFALLGASDADLQIVEANDSHSYLLVFSDTDVGIPCLVRLDGSDDPPVFMKPEGENCLVLTSPRYSVLQFDQLADGSFPWHSDPPRVEIRDRLPTEEELALLRAALTEGPSSRGGWPGWHYRFFGQDVLVACGHDYYQQPAEVPFWEIRTRSDKALLQALRTLWPIANLAARFSESQEPSLAAAVKLVQSE
jgi:hypothetical protein